MVKIHRLANGAAHDASNIINYSYLLLNRAYVRIHACVCIIWSETVRDE